MQGYLGLRTGGPSAGPTYVVAAAAVVSRGLCWIQLHFFIRLCPGVVPLTVTSPLLSPALARSRTKTRGPGKR